MPEPYELTPYRSQGLVDILDRILDKGLVIAGDIKVNLANVELLTIQIRLLVCSIDKAQEIGMNWWRTDPYFGGQPADTPALDTLTERLELMQQRLDALEAGRRTAPRTSTES